MSKQEPWKGQTIHLSKRHGSLEHLVKLLKIILQVKKYLKTLESKQVQNISLCIKITPQMYPLWQGALSTWFA
jgi:hypothetical protein